MKGYLKKNKINLAPTSNRIQPKIVWKVLRVIVAVRRPAGAVTPGHIHSMI